MSPKIHILVRSGGISGSVLVMSCKVHNLVRSGGICGSVLVMSCKVHNLVRIFVVGIVDSRVVVGVVGRSMVLAVRRPGHEGNSAGMVHRTCH